MFFKILLSETMDSMIQIKQSHNQSMQCGSASSFDELKPQIIYYVTVIWSLRSSGRPFECPNVTKFLIPQHSNQGIQYYYLCGTCITTCFPRTEVLLLIEIIIPVILCVLAINIIIAAIITAKVLLLVG